MGMYFSMASANVYVEEFNAAIRVSSHGHPDYMVPILLSVVNDGRLEDFAKHSEYAWLTEYDLDSTDGGLFVEDLIAVPGVGFAYPLHNDPIELIANVTEEGTSFIYADDETNARVDYHYLITKTGDVRELAGSRTNDGSSAKRTSH